MFRPQIGLNVEVYVNDMLVKSLDEDKHLDDLKETFDTLRRHQMKLNPSKCAFGVSSGKFLGFMVSQRGIEANPDKIQAILDMEPPKNMEPLKLQINAYPSLKFSGRRLIGWTSAKRPSRTLRSTLPQLRY